MLQRLFLIFLLLCYTCVCASAQNATLKGFVRDNKGQGVSHVVVANKAGGSSTETNERGYYTLELPANDYITVVYVLYGALPVEKSMRLTPGQTRSLDVTLTVQENTLKGATVSSKRSRYEAGSVELLTNKMVYSPSTVDGVTAMIKIAVGSHNELSSQYSVRGGNFDENLVYVNDFEIYRPFLVRSGQQEGLSFVNPDLVSGVNFSVGGFQARYGDKMSSVLDVTYKRPTQFAGSVMASLLGSNIHLEGASKNNRLTYLIGARQKSNQYLLQSQPTKGIYNPSFTDIQALVNYRAGKSWELELIGNYARNRFTFFPQTGTSSFGVLNQAYQLSIFYEGGEYDQFDSRFGGISAAYHRDSSNFRIKFLASAYQTHEHETYDIFGQYLFGELQTDMSKKDFGQIKTYLGTGGIHDFARNYLDMTVGDVGVRGSYTGRRNLIQFGAGGNVTHIVDDLHEWQRRDSAAFSQPYDPAGSITMARLYNSSSDLSYTRLTAFVQDNIHFDSLDKLTATVGVRANYSFLNQELVISPRVQLALKPVWKHDWLFKFATGLYAQPPFYREMRNFEGQVNTGLLAQKSYQAVLGTDYNFKLHKRPFKFTAETYYKYLWDLDPYRYDNVRIRYTGKNDAVGRIYGGEVRLYGDLSPGATSWISVGIMKAEQRIIDSPSIAGYDNYFPLPSDQRFMLGLYFEDYLRRNHNFKVHINGMYAAGLPVGSPYSKLYQDILRIPSYKRVDIGFSALLLDGERRERPRHSLFNNLKSIWASLEVFNLLSIQNTLSYAWIQDWTSQKVYAVPNRLTSRLLNVKVLVNF